MIGIRVLHSAVWLLLATAACQAQALLPYQGKKRPLIVFAPSDQHPSLLRQKSAINGSRTSISDRDIVVLYVIGQALAVEFANKPGVNAQSLRSLYRASEGAFRVLLLDKDGRTRLDTAAPLSAADIIAEVDRLPRRRDNARPRF